MIFVEKLTAIRLFKSALGKSKLFFGIKSVGARIAEILFTRVHIIFDSRKLDFGNIDIAPDIRKKAYETAEDSLELLKSDNWAKEVSRLLSIDFSLITKKFFFDELYVKYEFYEMAIRYAIENPHERHTIYIQQRFSEPYMDKLKSHFTICFSKEFDRFSFFCSVFLLPLLLLYYRRQNGIHDDLHFNNKMVCCIDCESTHEMYSNLFETCQQPLYVIERHNVDEFSSERLRELKIHVLGLSQEGYLYLKKFISRYRAVCLKHHRDISEYGVRLFLLFYTLIRGKAEAIQGKGNLFFTYEHLVTVKAVRNEYLRLEGSKSIFIPKNAHASPRYFHSEIFINYDVMCSAGKHIEELYKKKKTLTNIFLPTGSYDNHRRIVKTIDKNTRMDSLKNFKGNSIAITILSPGICDPTYSHEIKLMKLAQKLAAQDGIKVFIRLKPVPLISKYADFYVPYTERQNSILLMGAEYELFDFLEVTDLFITSISNSACDVALCGGQVMFIDYMKSPDLFLYWSMVDDMVLSEENAFPKIMAWVKDNSTGQIRSKYKESMIKLTDYIGYRFPDFESYKANLLKQLREQVFCDNPALNVVV